MTKNQPLVIVLGYEDANESKSYRAALQLREQLTQEGRRVEIIGNGTTDLPTPAQINERIAAIGEPVEVILNAHGANVPQGVMKGTAYENLDGRYALSIPSGRHDDNAPMVDMTATTSVPITGITPVEDVFRAMPSNVTAVRMESCYSGSALASADLLPKGTALYVSTTGDSPSSMVDGVLAMGNLAQNLDVVRNTSSLDDMAASYMARLAPPGVYTNFVVPPPTKMAISGEGTIDWLEAAERLKGRAISAGTVDALSSILANDKNDEQTFTLEDARAMKLPVVKDDDGSLHKVVQGLGDMLKAGHLASFDTADKIYVQTTNEVNGQPTEMAARMSIRNVMTSMVMVEVGRYATEHQMSLTQAIDAMEQEVKNPQRAAAAELTTPATASATAGAPSFANLVDANEFASLAAMQRGGAYNNQTISNANFAAGKETAALG